VNAAAVGAVKAMGGVGVGAADTPTTPTKETVRILVVKPSGGKCARCRLHAPEVPVIAEASVGAVKGGNSAGQVHVCGRCVGAMEG
jgi:hypothetical protein